MNAFLIIFQHIAIYQHISTTGQEQLFTIWTIIDCMCPSEQHRFVTFSVKQSYIPKHLGIISPWTCTLVHANVKPLVVKNSTCKDTVAFTFCKFYCIVNLLWNGKKFKFFTHLMPWMLRVTTSQQKLSGNGYSTSDDSSPAVLPGRILS